MPALCFVLTSVYDCFSVYKFYAVITVRWREIRW